MDSLQTLQGTFFSPNILFLRVPPGSQYDGEILSFVNEARLNRMGIQLYIEDPVAQLGRSASVNVWIREQSPDWDLSIDMNNIDLAMLSAYKLAKNWGATMRVITVVNESEVEIAYRYVDNLISLARLSNVSSHVEIGSFEGALTTSPQADVDFFGLPEDPDLERFRSYVEYTRSACVFVADSGNESILA